MPKKGSKMSNAAVVTQQGADAVCVYVSVQEWVPVSLVCLCLTLRRNGNLLKVYISSYLTDGIYFNSLMTLNTVKQVNETKKKNGWLVL